MSKDIKNTTSSTLNASRAEVVPLVSICCITYNHAPFIRQCLEGFLMQKTSFPIEILIHDDCSTDGTTEIVQEYAAKYPDLIFPLYETENQYSKGVWMDGFNYRRARGKYIAYCEGDDYWTDPLKLQKQVDFMEANPECSVCFHTFRNHIVQTDEYKETTPTQLLQTNANQDSINITVDIYFQKWYTQPMTMLFRISAFSFEWQKKYKYYRDQHEIYHLLKVGKGRLLNFDGGVRNVHSGGIASMISTSKQMIVSEEIAEELYRYNHDDPTKHFYLRTLQWMLPYAALPFSFTRLKYAWKVLMLEHNVRHFCKNIVRR